MCLIKCLSLNDQEKSNVVIERGYHKTEKQRIQNDGDQVKLVRKKSLSPPNRILLLLSCLPATALSDTLYLLK